VFKKFRTLVKNQSEKKIKILRTDGGAACTDEQNRKCTVLPM